MKYLITFILSTFWIVTCSQEKVLPADYRNHLSSTYCWYTKPDFKPFNGYIKVNTETPGTYWYKKIENGCHVTLHEVFNSKHELLYRGKYPYDKANNQILSYELDSVNLGKSELWDKELTDTL